MSFPSNVKNSDKEEMSDTSFVQNGGNLTANKEFVFTFVPVQEEKNTKLSENNTGPRNELHEETKPDYILHESANVQYYGNNLKETQPDPLAIHDRDVENVKIESPSIIYIKEENFTEEQEEREDIDLVEHKVESPVTNDNTAINIYGDRILSRESDERDTVRVQSTHNWIKNYECDECCKMFSTKQYIKNHIDRMHKGNKKNDCTKGLTTKEHNKRHTNIMHMGSKAYECCKCHRMFSYIGNLKRHIYNGHKNNYSFCNDYPEICSSAQTSKVHIDSSCKGLIKNENKKYQCKECGKLLSYTSIRAHINIVHKKIKYQCKECKGMFSTNQYLKLHIDQVHNGIKKHKCNVCHKFFTEAGNLKAHVDSVHKGIKKYECNECQRLFSQAGVLKRHIFSVHRKIKSYMCNDCHKTFSFKNVLKFHIESKHSGHKKIENHTDSIHKGIKYECSQCEKLFSQRGNLITHIKSIHEVIKNECN